MPCYISVEVNGIGDLQPTVRLNYSWQGHFPRQLSLTNLCLWNHFTASFFYSFEYCLQQLSIWLIIKINQIIFSQVDICPLCISVSPQSLVYSIIYTHQLPKQPKQESKFWNYKRINPRKRTWRHDEPLIWWHGIHGQHSFSGRRSVFPRKIQQETTQRSGAPLQIPSIDEKTSSKAARDYALGASFATQETTFKLHMSWCYYMESSIKSPALPTLWVQDFGNSTQ